MAWNDSNIRRKLRLNAKAKLEGYGIPWHEYDAGRIENHHDPIDGEIKGEPESVVFTHKKSGRQIRITGIIADGETGEILQVGHNYGDLTL